VFTARILFINAPLLAVIFTAIKLFNGTIIRMTPAIAIILCVAGLAITPKAQDIAFAVTGPSSLSMPVLEGSSQATYQPAPE
jgi:hypothetical protein